jgi:hypothetical protein
MVIHLVRFNKGLAAIISEQDPEKECTVVLVGHIPDWNFLKEVEELLQLSYEVVVITNRASHGCQGVCKCDESSCAVFAIRKLLGDNAAITSKEVDILKIPWSFKTKKMNKAFIISVDHPREREIVQMLLDENWL